MQNTPRQQNGIGRIQEEIAPPTQDPLVIQDKISLVLQLVWISIIMVPCILWDLFRKILPPAGKSLKGKIVLVTGAGRGLGKGLALRFAREGCLVAVADLNKPAVDQTASEINALGGVAKAYYTNVAKVEEVKLLQKGVAQDLGEVDVLVNNAGLIFGNPLESCTEEDIRAVITVNMLSHFWMIREFLPSMKKRNSGHVVAIASLSGLKGLANAGVYTASKFGISGLMENLRSELQLIPGNKVKTTTVYPYFINTSANYVDHWKVRLPPMTVEEAVEATIQAVKQEKVHASIPAHLYSLIHLQKLLPQYIIDQFDKLFYAEVTPTSPEDLAKSPTSAIIKDLSRRDLG